jgi:hypothetical protein
MATPVSFPPGYRLGVFLHWLRNKGGNGHLYYTTHAHNRPGGCIPLYYLYLTLHYLDTNAYLIIITHTRNHGLPSGATIAVFHGVLGWGELAPTRAILASAAALCVVFLFLLAVLVFCLLLCLD